MNDRFRYLHAYIRNGKVTRLELERLRPSERFIRDNEKKGIQIEYFTIDRGNPNNHHSKQQQ